ncbi:MAG: gliding motility protein GldL [Saprospirales bacterium]|nr:MAG: gliding motility protein GldL [Saprospirales bacterium]
MAFYKSNWFKYIKNLFIGLGAAAVMLGALYKIMAWPGGDLMLTIGLSVEAAIFAFLGILPPAKDYYWEKLYPGLDNYHSNIAPLTHGEAAKPIDGDVVEKQLGGMLVELESISKNMGSLKALQELDFSKTKDQIKTMGSFYDKMNEAMGHISESVEDTKNYRDQVAVLNKNLSSLNTVYGNVLNAFGGGQRQ